MKANEFVREFGWCASKEIIRTHNAVVDVGDGEVFHISDLRKLVDAWELVEQYGGLAEAKNIHYDECVSDTFYNKLKRAVELVESC